MNFADKLIQLRREHGWSQEELAERLDVTRQSVSKWEGAQSVPEVDKILLLGNIFGVSTDYLLRDGLREPERAGAPEPEAPDGAPARRVSMEKALEFLRAERRAAKPIACATFACIVSPVPLLLLSTLTGTRDFPAREERLALGVGLIALLGIIAAAVSVLLFCAGKRKPYRYLETELLEPESGVAQMARERRERLRGAHTRGKVLGTCLCLLSAVPVLAGAFFMLDAVWLTVLICGTLALAGAGVSCLRLASIPWMSLEKLLEEGAYTRKYKRAGFSPRDFTRAYWLLVLAAAIGYGFLAGGWAGIWIIWGIAGAAFPAFRCICRMLAARRGA